MNAKRIRTIKKGAERYGCIVYWMSRDQRANDNWALLFAQHLAMQNKSPLAAIFCLGSKFLDATFRQFDFMLKGLQEMEKALRKKNIPFFIQKGDPGDVISKFADEFGAAKLVTDFSPLRIKGKWTDEVSRVIEIPIYEVDAHNIVPCWIASDKREYAARTFRPKLMRLLNEFLVDFPDLKKHPFSWPYSLESNKWDSLADDLDLDRSLPVINWLIPGEKAGREMLKEFLESKLAIYDETRNDITKDGQSNLSPYLHFGQISAQRIALEVSHSNANDAAKEAFQDELIVRRELSDNFCYYTPNYDSPECFPSWARDSLDAHKNDTRDFIYTLDELESAQTHDEIWNSAQMEMVYRGKMHGYMRMYWGKKILEWTKSPEDALNIANFLNNKYELDGRDPNGYVGALWSIGGVHDRAWKEREVFGKVRYMNDKGIRRKFDADAYIEKVSKYIKENI